MEISLDIESAHAVCQSCHILLVEAGELSGHKLRGPAEYENLEAAEATAVALGANEVSNSWGGPEASLEGDTAFNHQGIVITASGGDYGFRNWSNPFGGGFVDYPATSPHVVAVGGTRLTLGPEERGQQETVWNGSGAGRKRLQRSVRRRPNGRPRRATGPKWAAGRAGPWPMSRRTPTRTRAS